MSSLCASSVCPLLWNGGNTSTYLVGLFGEFKELTYVQCLEQSLTLSKHHRRVTFYFLESQNLLPALQPFPPSPRLDVPMAQQRLRFNAPTEHHPHQVSKNKKSIFPFIHNLQKTAVQRPHPQAFPCKCSHSVQALSLPLRHLWTSNVLADSLTQVGLPVVSLLSPAPAQITSLVTRHYAQTLPLFTQWKGIAKKCMHSPF